jgi:hypothetical protein
MTRAAPTRSPAGLPPPLSRGVLGDVIAVCAGPAAFFRQMPAGRGWAVVALLTLVLVGAAAARPRATPAADPAAAFDPALVQPDPFALPADPLQAVLPTDLGAGLPDAAAPAASLDRTLTTALVAVGGVLGVWGAQALLLALVPMLGGRAPRVGRGLQVAVWAGVPLALTSVLQLAYTAAGGAGGAAGLSLALRYWEAYPAFSPLVQALLHSAAAQCTLFGLWSVLLLAVGARHGLRGRSWAVVLVIALWLCAAVLAPVAVGSIGPAENVFAPSAEGALTDPFTDGGLTEGGLTDPFTDGGLTDGFAEPDAPVSGEGDPALSGDDAGVPPAGRP